MHEKHRAHPGSSIPEPCEAVWGNASPSRRKPLRSNSPCGVAAERHLSKFQQCDAGASRPKAKRARSGVSLRDSGLGQIVVQQSLLSGLGCKAWPSTVWSPRPVTPNRRSASTPIAPPFVAPLQLQALKVKACKQHHKLACAIIVGSSIGRRVFNNAVICDGLIDGHVA